MHFYSNGFILQKLLKRGSAYSANIGILTWVMCPVQKQRENLYLLYYGCLHRDLLFRYKNVHHATKNSEPMHLSVLASVL